MHCIVLSSLRLTTSITLPTLALPTSPGPKRSCDAMSMCLYEHTPTRAGLGSARRVSIGRSCPLLQDIHLMDTERNRARLQLRHSESLLRPGATVVGQASHIPTMSTIPVGASVSDATHRSGPNHGEVAIRSNTLKERRGQSPSDRPGTRRPSRRSAGTPPPSRAR